VKEYASLPPTFSSTSSVKGGVVNGSCTQATFSPLRSKQILIYLVFFGWITIGLIHSDSSTRKNDSCLQHLINILFHLLLIPWVQSVWSLLYQACIRLQLYIHIPQGTCNALPDADKRVNPLSFHKSD
jgi:hypothetical protein